MNANATTNSGIGGSVRRREDSRFLQGRGKYTDDINIAGQTYAVFVRSPHAHARINGIDTAAAAAAEGVAAVFTAEHTKDIGGVPTGWQVHSKDGEPMAEPKHPVLAEGAARHVGDPVAMVIAATRRQARDAAELVTVDYDPQPAAVDMKAALADGAAKVHGDLPGNLCYDWELGDKAAVDEAFAGAAHVTKLDLVNNRLIPNAVEPRCAIGDYDSVSGEHTLYTTSQNPHVIRLLMGAFVLSIPEHKLRVVAPDVGGGFGSKIFHYAEEALVTWAAAQIKKPVKWTAERSESFMSDAHGRDHVTHAELALDANGKFLALRCSTLANMGAYLSTFAPCIPTYLHGTLLAGQYATPAIYCEVKAVFTNTVPVDAYRGAGRPEATFILERIVDQAAAETGVDPAELRRRNMIQPEQFPYQTPVALQYDTGNYEATLDQALKAADYAGFEARRKQSAAAGKLRGVGLSCYIEACGIAPSNVVGSLGARAGLYEAATVRVNPTGSVVVFTGSHAHGQGHETTFAQVVSDMLGIDYDAVEIVHGDTAKVPFGMGTYGSRSIAVGGAAIAKAVDKIIAKGKKIAAHLLEAGEGDIVFENGAFKVAGTDREKSFGDIALTAYVPHQYPLESLEPGLEETAFYDPANFTYPAGTYVCEVEVDPDTGQVTVASFHASDDFGNLINPMIVEGQVHGGLAQGIGQALLENCVYDAEGQLLSGSYMDYCMPRADDLPSFQVDTTVTACTHNPLGVKGCGEAGAIGAPPALINAVVNALNGGGHSIAHLDMPATPQKVWAAMQSN
ncbi:MAG: xanthine dehydrogenase family protein molybdopterin-binding subunit [Gammaproteobacteria bacterium]|nr:xanthine dehydrogenase family protein molybdopterin-binding subunit [Gammaproteobacteria bacterium]MDD9800743.1 xanthine dehydrogenase family protein molybdopterin-binding subunit [Gammaproteobacteria bacterium]MDD9851102.1 xanthine dehydrogenase family protein molybdopterin-binding subunit [Gammaproteobacteria bacterium]MDD9869962.1 xanthine dehydrogenase family protein molybdopterin-binding subunit [Gammaproteobacteria bacterium]